MSTEPLEPTPPFDVAGRMVVKDGDPGGLGDRYETVYVCPSCAALVKQDGMERHDRWHQRIIRMFAAAGVRARTTEGVASR